MEQPISEAQLSLIDLLWIAVLMPFETPAYLFVTWSPLFAASFYYITSRERFRWSATEIAAAQFISSLFASVALVAKLLLGSPYKRALRIAMRSPANR